MKPRTQPKPFKPLSERETETLQAFADGYDKQEVAILLCVNPETIATRTHRVYKKLGVRNLAQAIVVGVRLGIVEIKVST
jgi:DNA-binding NarL/FixJ family response regulator